MRKALLPVLAASVLVWVGAATAELKLGYIDSEVLKERLPEFKNAQQSLDQLKQDFEREAKDREAKLQKLQEDFKKQELLMSEARKAEMQAEFDEKVKALQDFTQRPSRSTVHEPQFEVSHPTVVPTWPRDSRSQ